MNRSYFKILKEGEPIASCHLSMQVPQGTISLYLVESPFANCQVFTLGNAQQLKYVSKDQIDDVYKELIKVVPKKLMMIDINQMYKPFFEEHFKGYIKMSSDYNSTSGSKMCVMLIEVWRKYNG